MRKKKKVVSKQTQKKWRKPKEKTVKDKSPNTKKTNTPAPKNQEKKHPAHLAPQQKKTTKSNILHDVEKEQTKKRP